MNRIMMNVHAIGLVKNMLKEPWLVMRAFRILLSKSGASTNERIIGAVLYPLFSHM